MALSLANFLVPRFPERGGALIHLADSLPTCTLKTLPQCFKGQRRRLVDGQLSTSRLLHVEFKTLPKCRIEQERALESPMHSGSAASNVMG